MAYIENCTRVQENPYLAQHILASPKAPSSPLFFKAHHYREISFDIFLTLKKTQQRAVVVGPHSK